MANILVIDDESVLLGLISNTLRYDGHNVTHFCDPLAALAAQRTRQAPIDLLLTDINTKPISGFELVKRLNKSGLHNPVVFMSGFPSISGVVSKGLGKQSVLEKPFTAAELRSAVRSALTEARHSPLTTKQAPKKDKPGTSIDI